jgi:hypothetical protein
MIALELNRKFDESKGTGVPTALGGNNIFSTKILPGILHGSGQKTPRLTRAANFHDTP